MDDHHELVGQLVRSVLWTDVPDALLLVNHGGIVAANPSAVDLLGYERAVLERMMVEDLVPPGIAEAHRRWRAEFQAVADRRSMRRTPDPASCRTTPAPTNRERLDHDGRR